MAFSNFRVSFFPPILLKSVLDWNITVLIQFGRNNLRNIYIK